MRATTVRVRVNGQPSHAQAWQPYRWNSPAACRPATNDLQINVYASPAGRGGGGGGGNAGGERARWVPRVRLRPIAAAGGGNRFRGVTFAGGFRLAGSGTVGGAPDAETALVAPAAERPDAGLAAGGVISTEVHRRQDPLRALRRRRYMETMRRLLFWP